MKVLFVFGTRPEAIKLAPLIRRMSENRERFEVRVCVTGQHREMLDQVLALFEIVPDHDLRVMRPRQDLVGMTRDILEGLGTVLGAEQPDWLVVQGDTTTTLAASLAAFYSKIPVAHVEAGLRTGDPHSPFPEEMNRLLTSRLAELHFAPTEDAKTNLLREGVAHDHVHVTGNTIVDALMAIADGLERDESMRGRLDAEFSFLSVTGRLVLVTAHRRESLGEGIESICRALSRIAAAHHDVEIVYPVHLNPGVRDAVARVLGEGSNRLHLIEPVDYLAMIYLMKRAYLILTDSGGIQEEAPSLGTPVLLMREVTERPEGVAAGVVRIVGTNESRIVEETSRVLENEEIYSSMTKSTNPFGDGHACERILAIMARLQDRE